MLGVSDFHDDYGRPGAPDHAAADLYDDERGAYASNMRRYGGGGAGGRMGLGDEYDEVDDIEDM